MAHLSIEHLHVSYAAKPVLEDIDLVVEQGEMVALLGPSGCGKTTLLNALCGFVSIEKGRIRVSGHDITHAKPEQRNITMVFQSYALWPHMTVAENIGYGLKLRKVERAEKHHRIEEMLSAVNLQGLAHERVTTLSGGQRQRVALARALAIRPDVLLLDEPLSNLDAKVRLTVRDEIKALQQRFGFTAMLVTHDQEEALVMADKVAVLNRGRIEQMGTPQAIYDAPATAFVADFMGADNQIDYVTLTASVDDTNLRLSADSVLKLPRSKKPIWSECNTCYFRSEAVRVSAADERVPLYPEDGFSVRGEVEQSIYLGSNYRIHVRCGELLISALHPHAIPAHQFVTLTVPNQALYVF
jgi:ABC-type Fe3+/spermidine/putrescine transport system ATPase subunit